MNPKPFLITYLILLSSLNYAQELNALVLDSLDQNPIPYASIYLQSGSGVVSNEEGLFRLRFSTEQALKDSLFISCMGYQTLTLPLSSIKDSIFYLSPKTIALNSVILSNKQLSISQILKKIKEDIPEKYELGLTKKKLFFRQTGSEEFLLLDVAVKRTSISEFNQAFWDSTLQKVPRKNDWYTELTGTLYGDYSKENQKFDLEKALELEDKKTSAIFESIEQVFDTILKENIKKDSYFKIRSGIIGGKLDLDDFPTQEKDTLTPEERINIRKKTFLTSKKSLIQNLQNSIFKDDDLNISIINESNKYNFEHSDFTYINDVPVYVLTFIPKGNADFSGKLYVDADRMTIIRLEYKNIQNIRDFNLLGVSFIEDMKEVILQFKKTSNGKYGIEYLELSNSNEVGFKRPLVITEKNKVVKGRNKQNQLKMDLDIKTRLFQKFQLAIFENLPISKEVFEESEEGPGLLPVNLTKYDPSFWKGYTIIEPNETIKAFKVTPIN